MKTFRDDPLTPHPYRGDYVSVGKGVAVGLPLPKPSVIAGHIDGPLLIFSDGQMHWLSVSERVMVRLGLHNAASLQVKLRPNLTKWLTGSGASPCVPKTDGLPPGYHWTDTLGIAKDGEYDPKRSNPPTATAVQQEKG
jgi:hypothetical protein